MCRVDNTRSGRDLLFCALGRAAWGLVGLLLVAGAQECCGFGLVRTVPIADTGLDYLSLGVVKRLIVV